MKTTKLKAIRPTVCSGAKALGDPLLGLMGAEEELEEAVGVPGSTIAELAGPNMGPLDVEDALLVVVPTTHAPPEQTCLVSNDSIRIALENFNESGETYPALQQALPHCV
jgi:hypothetical protein